MVKNSEIKSIVTCQHIVMVIVLGRGERLRKNLVSVHGLFLIRKGEDPKNLVFWKGCFHWLFLVLNI